MKLSALFVLALAMAVSARMTSLSEIMRPHASLKSDLQELGIDFNLETMIENFIEGAHIGYLVPNSTACFHSNLQFFRTIQEKLEAYQKKKTRDNFFAILQAFENMTPLVTDCFETFVDAEKAIRDYAAEFNYNPVTYIDSFKNNFMKDLFMISAEATQLYNDLASLDFDKGALDLGQLMYHIFVFNNTVSAFENIQYSPNLSHMLLGSFAENVQDFFDGYLNGTQVFNTEYNLQCANSTRWYIESWNAAIKAFQKGGEDGQREGWTYIAQAFSYIYPLSFNCLNGIEEQIAALKDHGDW